MGYHVCKDVLDAPVGEQLECARESDNSVDCCAAVMMIADKHLRTIHGQCQGYI